MTIKDASLETVSNEFKMLGSRAVQLIPQTVEELQLLLDKVKNNIATKPIAHQLSMDHLLPRSMDWIKSEGKCLGKIAPKKSTVSDAGTFRVQLFHFVTCSCSCSCRYFFSSIIKFMLPLFTALYRPFFVLHHLSLLCTGRGAFAQQFIPKGESVVIAPLLHIMDYKSAFMYDLQRDEDGTLFRDMEKANDEAIGAQLISNYCFSHDQSTMLLCPQTNAAIINHCSDRGDFDGDCSRYNRNEDTEMRGANAEIRWAVDWDSDTEEWLKMSIEEIEKQVKKDKRGLSLEVIAKRDIYPGDEVRNSTFWT